MANIYSSVRAIEPISTGEYKDYYTRKIERFSHTYEYDPVKLKRVKAITTSKYITNTKTLKKNQTFSPDPFTSKYNKVDKLVKYEMNMTYGKTQNNTELYFDRLYSVYLDMEMDNLCQYVFMVRPNLNIYKDSNPSKLATLTKSQINAGFYANSAPAKDQFFRYMKKTYPYMLQSLTHELAGSHDFIPYLVGRTESLQIPDYSVKGYKMNQPYTNYELPYASHALDSATGGEFDMTFREDGDLKIHKFFQAWLYYIDGVTRNRFSPKTKYITHNKIDYATSVYCITCKADAETIVYWTKYTGAYPTSVPNSDLSFNLRGSVNNKVTIPFTYFLQEAMDPYILVDFNKNAHVTKSNSQAFIPVYRSDTIKYTGLKDYRSSSQKKLDARLDGSKVRVNLNAPATLGSGNALVGSPFICKVKEGGKYVYKLRWKRVASNKLSGK